jgi:hypothetical protein
MLPNDCRQMITGMHMHEKNAVFVMALKLSIVSKAIQKISLFNRLKQYNPLSFIGAFCPL